MSLDELLNSSAASPQHALASAAAEIHVIQDFTPLTDSIEWQASRLHWESAGTRPFANSHVPYVVNNAGWLARLTAEVLVANFRRHPAERLALLELGAGTGLFALQLLQAIEIAAPELLERIVFHITDASTATVGHWEQNRQFEHFARQVRPIRCDAADIPAIPGGTFRAVFANYLLDSLPMAVVRRGSGGMEQLCVRSLIRQRDECLRHIHGFDASEAARLAGSSRDEDRARLIDLLPLIEAEAEFRAADPPPPYSAEAIELSGGERTMLNHGALRTLDACLGRLDPAGMILINDYGPVAADQVAAVAYVQRFGLASAACLNFPLVESHVTRAGCSVYRPSRDEQRTIHARLVMRTPCDATAKAFVSAFSQEWVLAADQSGNHAIEHIIAGRYDQAMDVFQQALANMPDDWNLLSQAAEFLLQQLDRPAQSLELALLAAKVNPWYSPLVWNTLGNALFRLGRHHEAYEAYCRAESIDPDDPQAQLNLAYAHTHFGDYGRALAAVARGLANDQTGRFKAHLLDKQGQAVALLAAQCQAMRDRADQRAIALGAAK
ncbi:MAG: SAM-dependent methyltransferase [Tepidisphaeraceae bacterium]|jgi:tetratricopeptide (TPR) repeat protein